MSTVLSAGPLARPGLVLQAGRIASIDLMRALTVLVMIMVNEWHGVQGLPAWMKHMPADADAMSFVDVVFPAFLFIVGMSIPFALQQRESKGASLGQQLLYVLQRGLGLVLMGVFMVNAEGGHHAASMVLPIAAWALLSYLAAYGLWGGWARRPLGRTWRVGGVLLFLLLALLYRGGPQGEQGLAPQWWGILGLIGWAYLVASLAYLAAQRLGAWAAPALLGMAVLCVLYFVAGASQEASASTGLAASLLSEGGQASHVAIVLGGMVCALIFFQQGRLGPSQRLALALGLALVAALAAAALRPAYPISKIHATPSWALYCVALCAVIYAALHQLTRGGLKPPPLQGLWGPVAAHPLLAYLLPFVLGWTLALLGLSLPAFLQPAWPGVLYGPVLALAVAGLVAWLDQRGASLRI